MVSYDLVNIGSCNGLMPVGTKPLPEPMFDINEVLWHVSEGSVTETVPDKSLYKVFEIYIFEITATSPMGQ